MVKRLFVFLALLVAVATAQDYKGTLKTDSLKYTVGDIINLTVTVKHPSSVKVLFPPILDSLKSVEFLKNDTLITTEENGQTISSKHYQLMGFDSARVTLGPFVFPGQNNNQPISIVTDSISLFVSTVAVDTSAQLKDIKEPIEIPFDWKFALMIAGIVLLVLALIYYLYRRWKNRDIPVVIPRDDRTPEQIALERLTKLQASGLLQKGEYKLFYSELTELLREFFEKTYGVKALEETSQELIAELKKISELKEVVKEIELLLEHADMVKFAKYIPLENKASLDAVTTGNLITKVWGIFRSRGGV